MPAPIITYILEFGKSKGKIMNEIIINESGRRNKTDSPIVRMEGIKEAAALFGLPKHLVRTLALEGKVKAVRVSNSPNSKILVNIQSLNDYFENAVISNEEQADTSGGIQPIPVRL